MAIRHENRIIGRMMLYILR